MSTNKNDFKADLVRKVLNYFEIMEDESLTIKGGYKELTIEDILHAIEKVGWGNIIIQKYYGDYSGDVGCLIDFYNKENRFILIWYFYGSCGQCDEVMAIENFEELEDFLNKLIGTSPVFDTIEELLQYCENPPIKPSNDYFKHFCSIIRQYFSLEEDFCE